MATLAEILKSKSTAARAVSTRQPTPPIASALPTFTQAVAAPAPIAHFAKSDPIARVDLILTRNRIDVYFRAVPTQAARNLMKSEGWRYSPDRVCWYHADTELNRDLLRSEFGVQLEAKELWPIAAAPETADDDQIVEDPDGSGDISASALAAREAKPLEIIARDTVFTPEYATFRAQVDQLIAELKVAPADLMLLAIDTLHKKTFSRDS